MRAGPSHNAWKGEKCTHGPHGIAFQTSAQIPVRILHVQGNASNYQLYSNQFNLRENQKKLQRLIDYVGTATSLSILSKVLHEQHKALVFFVISYYSFVLMDNIIVHDVDA